MMTLEEIQKCYDEKVPVIVHNPDNENCFCRNMVGFIDRIVPESQNAESREKQTYQEPCVWILFPTGDCSFKWSHEFRIARLRNPLVINRTFIHTSSNRYAGDDMSHELKSKKAKK